MPRLELEQSQQAGEIQSFVYPPFCREPNFLEKIQRPYAGFQVGDVVIIPHPNYTDGREIYAVIAEVLPNNQGYSVHSTVWKDSDWEWRREIPRGCARFFGVQFNPSAAQSLQDLTGRQ